MPLRPWVFLSYVAHHTTPVLDLDVLLWNGAHHQRKANSGTDPRGAAKHDRDILIPCAEGRNNRTERLHSPSTVPLRCKGCILMNWKHKHTRWPVHPTPQKCAGDKKSQLLLLHYRGRRWDVGGPLFNPPPIGEGKIIKIKKQSCAHFSNASLLRWVTATREELRGNRLTRHRGQQCHRSTTLIVIGHKT